MNSKYRIGQSSRIDIHEKEFYKWSVWLEEDQVVLDRISSVEYILHPSFKTRVRKTEDRVNKFKFNASGWGEFMINIKIHEKTGNVVHQQYWLILGEDYNNLEPQPEPGKTADKPKTIFFSYSTYDSEFANLLLNKLKDQGINVITSNDAPIGESWIDFLQQSISDAQALVTVIPPYENTWQKQEIDIAKGASVPIIPVAFNKINTSSIASITDTQMLYNKNDSIENLSKEILNKL